MGEEPGGKQKSFRGSQIKVTKSMKAEIIFIGTELLLGQVLNSNAVFLGRELAALGIDCYFETIVGDNKERIKASFQTALDRADLIITTGGLGPTSDDLTTECWAELFDEELVFDEAVFQKIKERFERANKSMVESNRKQAYRPKSSDTLPNPAGTAPGIIWDVSKLYEAKRGHSQERKLVMTFPGVPKELKAMWDTTAKKFLMSLNASAERLFWKELKFYGIGESALAERVQDLLDLTDPTVAPLAGRDECRLRIACKGLTHAEAEEKLERLETEIKARVGQFLYGYDDDTLESVLGELLKQNKQTLAVAESCTGGLLSERLTSVPGSSAYVNLNVITYSNNSKKQILEVSEEALNSFGAVSQVVALQMAKGIKKLAKSDWSIAITGIAGPDGGTAEKPVGSVYIAWVGEGIEEVKLFQFGARKREDIRWSACQEALNGLRQHLLRVK